jgi:hypothetical protein
MRTLPSVAAALSACVALVRVGLLRRGVGSDSDAMPIYNDAIAGRGARRGRARAADLRVRLQRGRLHLAAGAVAAAVRGEDDAANNAISASMHTNKRTSLQTNNRTTAQSKQTSGRPNEDASDESIKQALRPRGPPSRALRTARRPDAPTGRGGRRPAPLAVRVSPWRIC